MYGQNISNLARMTGHSRNTIKKAIRGEPWGYKERSHQPFPVLDKYLPVIDGWLAGDKDKPKKQRHTARRVTEVLQGFQSYNDYKTASDLLLRIPFMPMGGQAIALESAANYRLLRRKGITVRKTIDVMIGTFCIHYQLPLLHDDRDFDPMVKFLRLIVIQT